MIDIHVDIRYESEEDRLIVIKIINQQNHITRSAFKKLNAGYSVTFNDFNFYNDIDYLDSWLRHSAIHDANSLIEKDSEENIVPKKVIFGGKKNFLARQKVEGRKQISKEEYKQNRLRPLYVVGERDSGKKRVHGNRKFKIQEDLESVIFKTKNVVTKERIKIRLLLPKLYGNTKDNFIRVLQHQIAGDIPITYKLGTDDVLHIVCDETDLYSDIEKVEPIKNRIFSIDQNPNYLGWSVIDWKDDYSFDVVASGVISLKGINVLENDLKEAKLPSNDPKRIHLNNKRKHEVLNCSELLMKKVKHYRCEMFSIEDLNIKLKDNKKGHKYNKLVNNLWVRNALENNLKKRCNILGVKFYSMVAAYSSFVGNFLFRHLQLPDMVLASIEISRRCFEFHHKLVLKDMYCPKVSDSNGKKHYDKTFIVQPELYQFKTLFIKSMEEFGLADHFGDFKEIYKELKDSKTMYRVSLDNFKNLKFFRVDSDKSLVRECIFARRTFRT